MTESRTATLWSVAKRARGTAMTAMGIWKKVKTMNDLISRADAIEAVHNWYDQPYKDIKDYIRGVDKIALDIEALPSAVCDDCIWHACNYNKIDWDAPSAEAVQGWIPCSERLPECGFGLHYLVTLKDGHDFMDDVYEAFFDKYGWHVGDNELAYDDVIAWMPLPKPYREESEDKE